MNNISKFKKKIPTYSKKCAQDFPISLKKKFETFIFLYMWVEHLRKYWKKFKIWY